MSWFRPLLGVLKDLDEAIDRTAELFHEHVTPVVQGAARRLDSLIEDTGEQLTSRVRSHVSDLDERYQRFMVMRVDPLFGQLRSEQLGEMGGLALSAREVALNRKIGLSALVLVVVTAGGAIYPPSLLVTVPLAFTTMLPTYAAAIDSVRQQRTVTYQVVSAINVTGIWLGGFYIPAMAASLLFFMGEKLLLITEDRTKKELISVFSQQPQTVWLLRDGTEQSLPIAEVMPGDVVVVSTGELMPVDGTVMQGLAAVDEQVLTGEAQPVDKAPGDSVFAATLVCAGKVYVRVEKAGNETVSAQIAAILDRTASYQLALQAKGNQIANRFAVPTLALGGLALLTRGTDSGLAILNSAFGISLRVSAPITMLNLLNIASAHAILLKDGRSLALLSEVDTVLFDKTGTLTLARPAVAGIHVVGGFDPEQLLTFAATAEYRQTHPIALAILAEAERRRLVLPEPDDSRYEVGYGIKVALGNRLIQVGSDRFMELAGIGVGQELCLHQQACHARGHSLIMVAVDGQLAGAIELQPTVRPEAEAVVQALHRRGLKTVIISGDQEEPTRRLAARLGIERYFASVLPAGKAKLVSELQANGHSVCFVGDGINDAIALQRANVSVSLHGATSAATDVAQVILMQESIQLLPYLFALADDMDRSLRAAYAADLIPGVINVAGVFLLGWGFYPAIALSMASMAAGLGLAMQPMYKHRRTLTPTRAAPGDAAVLPQLVQVPAETATA